MHHHVSRFSSRVFAFFAVCVLCVCVQPARAQLRSPQQVMNAGGSSSASTNFRHSGSLGQSSPPGCGANSAAINYGGFWGGGCLPGTLSWYLLTVDVTAGSGTGRVTGSGIDCPGDCRELYPAGSVLPLVAQEDEDSLWTCWTLDDPGSDCLTTDDEIVVTRDLTAFALFEQCPWPKPFSLLTPADGATNQPLATILSWESSANAASYTVFVDTTSPPDSNVSVAAPPYAPPTPLEPGTTYFWWIEAANSCVDDPVSSPTWSFTTTQLPVITSTPPEMGNRTYRYDVEAEDPDGDRLTFNLSDDAPEGMTIDADGDQLVWTADESQLGTQTATITVSDGKGGTASQTVTLTVTAETFSAMTVSFLEGVNLHDGDTEQDTTVLSLGVGTDMSSVTDIVLPNMGNLFSFSVLASFHVELQGGEAVIVPEPGVAQIAVEDTAGGGKGFEEILASTLTELTWTTPADVTVTDTTSIVFQRSDGTNLKIGHFTLNVTEGTLTFDYADVTP